MKKIYSILSALFVVLTCFGSVGGGEINGVVADQTSGETIIGATVQAKVNGEIIRQTITDAFGKYTLKPLDVGVYDIEVRHLSYGTVEHEAIDISDGESHILDVKMTFGIDIPIVTITPRDDLIEIEPHDVPTGGEFRAKEIEKQPGDLRDVITTTAGVYQDGLGELRVRGSRSGDMVYFVDGVKMSTFPSIPRSGIYSMRVYTGAIPAKYGDTTAGVVEITTKSVFTAGY